MPRKARIVLPGIAHHVVQRGNYQQKVFEQDRDFKTYAYLIKQYAMDHQLQIHAYCLMFNHVHFIITPSQKHSLAELFRSVHVRYSQYKNLQWGKLGQLWQGRYFSCVLSQTHLLRAIRYVEMNPVRAQLVKNPCDYVWSSARQHLRIEKSPIIKTDFHEECLRLGLDYKNWDEYLLNNDQEMIKQIRSNTKKGLAVGDENFITQMESRFGVILRRRKPGRVKVNNK